MTSTQICIEWKNLIQLYHDRFILKNNQNQFLIPYLRGYVTSLMD